MALRPDDPRWAEIRVAKPGGGGDDDWMSLKWLPDFLLRDRARADALYKSGSGKSSTPASPSSPSLEAGSSLPASQPAPLGGQSVAGGQRAPPGANTSFYMRSAEITSVNRIGRRMSVRDLHIKAAQDVEIGAGVDPKELVRRVSVASGGAADPAFDFTSHRDMALAGAGTLATFHFLALDASASSHGSGHATVTPEPAYPLRAVPAPTTLPHHNMTFPRVFDGILSANLPSFLAPHRLPPLKPVSALPAPALNAVQHSWSLVKGIADAAVGASAFGKLLTRDPEKLKLFGFRADPNFVTRCACGQRFIGSRLPSHV